MITKKDENITSGEGWGIVLGVERVGSEHVNVLQDTLMAIRAPRERTVAGKDHCVELIASLTKHFMRKSLR